MKSAARDLVKYAISKGYRVTVDDGETDEEDLTVRESRSITAIMEDAKSVDDTYLIFTKDGCKREVAHIVFGNEPDEEVADFSINGMIDEWFDKFMEEVK